MVVPSFNTLQTFNGGQLTDLPPYPGGVDLTALFEVVSPGNVEQGINYSISAQAMSILIGVPVYINNIIIAGAVYNSVATDTRILINKTIGSATDVFLLASAFYGQPVLVKDIKGDADVNPITVHFHGTEKMDNLSSVVINNPYGYFWFNPLASGFYGTT